MLLILCGILIISNLYLAYRVTRLKWDLENSHSSHGITRQFLAASYRRINDLKDQARKVNYRLSYTRETNRHVASGELP